MLGALEAIFRLRGVGGDSGWLNVSYEGIGLLHSYPKESFTLRVLVTLAWSIPWASD
jgi:hypothetical protein